MLEVIKPLPHPSSATKTNGLKEGRFESEIDHEKRGEIGGVPVEERAA
jgi:hypothetical protein